MKRNLLLTTLGGVVLAGLFSASASAQTCAAPASWTPDTTGDPILAGSTCGNETGIAAACNDAFGAPSAAFVAQINVAAEGTFNNIDFTGGAGYTIAAYLVPSASGCGNFACTTTGDETTDMLHGDIGPGSYYLIITGADFDAQGACGTFTAAADGTLPVTLQDFSII